MKINTKGIEIGDVIYTLNMNGVEFKPVEFFVDSFHFNKKGIKVSGIICPETHEITNIPMQFCHKTEEECQLACNELNNNTFVEKEVN